MKKAVLLLSGGLDSTTALAIAKAQGFEVYALSFAYGQRHKHELDAAAKIAAHYGVHEHRIITIDLGGFGGSALTENDIAVPKDRSDEELARVFPITYVPARNTIFLSFALAWAEVLKAYDIFIGVNALDYSGYPDCRPEFIAAFEQMANLATAYGVEDGKRIKIHTPLIQLSKAEIIRKGVELGVDYGLTTSCYDPDSEGRACGHCDSCQLRLKGFRENGLIDPAQPDGTPHERVDTAPAADAGGRSRIFMSATHLPLPFEGSAGSLGDYPAGGMPPAYCRCSIPMMRRKPSTARPSASGNSIQRLHNEDIIAVPLMARQEVALAEVTGRYHYQVGENGEDMHLMPVKWYEKRIAARVSASIRNCST